MNGSAAVVSVQSQGLTPPLHAPPPLILSRSLNLVLPPFRSPPLTPPPPSPHRPFPLLPHLPFFSAPRRDIRSPRSHGPPTHRPLPLHRSDIPLLLLLPAFPHSSRFPPFFQFSPILPAFPHSSRFPPFFPLSPILPALSTSSLPSLSSRPLRTSLCASRPRLPVRPALGECHASGLRGSGAAQPGEERLWGAQQAEGEKEGARGRGGRQGGVVVRAGGGGAGDGGAGAGQDNDGLDAVLAKHRHMLLPHPIDPLPHVSHPRTPSAPCINEPFLFSPLAPLFSPLAAWSGCAAWQGDPAWRISEGTVQEVRDLSLNFFYVLPALNAVPLLTTRAHPSFPSLTTLTGPLSFSLFPHPRPNPLPPSSSCVRFLCLLPSHAFQSVAHASTTYNQWHHTTIYISLSLYAVVRASSTPPPTISAHSTLLSFPRAPLGPSAPLASPDCGLSPPVHPSPPVCGTRWRRHCSTWSTPGACSLARCCSPTPGAPAWAPTCPRSGWARCSSLTVRCRGTCARCWVEEDEGSKHQVVGEGGREREGTNPASRFFMHPHSIPLLTSSPCGPLLTPLPPPTLPAPPLFPNPLSPPVFLIPIMALRLRLPPPPHSTTPLRPAAIATFLSSAPLPIALVSSTVALASLFWAALARPDFAPPDLTVRAAFLADYLGSNRLAYAFAWDVLLYSLFQPWLIADCLSALRRSRPAEAAGGDEGGTTSGDYDALLALLQWVRFVPLFGLAAFLCALPRLRATSELQGQE
ncbi:unnamed protein product [Closterium sp. Naga37s-1]|nr:unnamed protein product [Closterium sp. Naga37s-1]